MRFFVKGFLLGFACGVVVGILLPPRKGAKSRTPLQQRVQEAVVAGRQARTRHADRLLARYRKGVGEIEPA